MSAVRSNRLEHELDRQAQVPIPNHSRDSREGSINQGLAYDSIKAGKYRLRALLMTSPDFTGGAAEPISLYSGLVDAVDGSH